MPECGSELNSGYLLGLNKTRVFFSLFMSRVWVSLFNRVTKKVEQNRLLLGEQVETSDLHVHF